MRKLTNWTALVLVSWLLVAAASGDEKAASAHESEPRQSEQALTPLADVLAAVGKTSGRRFAVSRRAPAQVALGGFDLGRIDYPVLLQILDNNGLGVVSVDGVTSVVPLANIRSMPTASADADLPGGEMVTRVLRVDASLTAAQLVPVLRPLLPNYAHLASHAESNSLIVVDRLANVERLQAIIAQLSENAPTPE